MGGWRRSYRVHVSMPAARAQAVLRPPEPWVRRRSARGLTLVEFALMAPVICVLIIGMVIVTLVITNQIQLSNAVRDGARAAAVCGSNPNGTTQLPAYSSNASDRQCTTANVVKYIQARLQSVPAQVNFTVTVFVSGVNVGTDIRQCQPGASVEVKASFPQPLYAPLVGQWLGDNGGNTRSLSADAEATCEQ